MNIEQIKQLVSSTDINYSPYYGVIPELIVKNGYKIGIEIGVFCGGHAKKILETGVSLIGIDPYSMYKPGMPGMESQSDWDRLYMYVMGRFVGYNYEHIRSNSDEAFRLVKNNRYDFVFIDGMHTYGQLEKDLDNYGSIVSSGGIIACHDYNHPSFPDLTTCIDRYADKNGYEIKICPLHLIYMIKK